MVFTALQVNQPFSMNFQTLLQQQFLGNTVRDYGIALLIVLAGYLAMLVFGRFVLRYLKRLSAQTKTNFDDFIASAIEKTVVPFLNAAIFYTAVQTLKISARYGRLIDNVWMVVFTFFAIRLVVAFVEYILLGYVRRKYQNEDRSKEVRGLLLMVSVALWLIGVVFLLDNLGYDVATVIAGLGIGGIAVALAAQTILGDLFGYFVIFFDRPFEVGDFIIVDEKMGTVETVGIKTTRLRSLSGEELIFSNKNLTDSRVHNYKRMQRRRVVFRFGVVYGTTADTLEAIPVMARQIIEGFNDTTFDRAHFSAFGNSSLDFEVVYHMLTGDHNKYMDRQQSINLALLRMFEEKGIEFAFPTQTIYMHQITGAEAMQPT